MVKKTRPWVPPLRACRYCVVGCSVTLSWQLDIVPVRIDPSSLYAYPRHVRASMLPKKETKYSCSAFQARERRDKRKVWLSRLLQPPWNRRLPLGLFWFFNTKNAQKIPKFLSGNPDGTWSVQLFFRGPDDFWASNIVQNTVLRLLIYDEIVCLSTCWLIYEPWSQTVNQM